MTAQAPSDRYAWSLRHDEVSTHEPARPAVMGEYVPRFIPGYRARDDLRPLEISQPEGTSFQLDGNALSWQPLSCADLRPGPSAARATPRKA